jgi:voltage-gated potassium channel
VPAVNAARRGGIARARTRSHLVTALSASLRHRGFGYVVVLTMLVTVGGSAGMYSFERDCWPRTAEGRLLMLLLALYAFSILGYVTAVLATYFVGRDADDPRAEVAGSDALQSLRREIAALRRDVRAVAARELPPTDRAAERRTSHMSDPAA